MDRIEVWDQRRTTTRRSDRGALLSSRARPSSRHMDQRSGRIHREALPRIADPIGFISGSAQTSAHQPRKAAAVLRQSRGGRPWLVHVRFSSPPDDLDAHLFGLLRWAGRSFSSLPTRNTLAHSLKAKPFKERIYQARIRSRPCEDIQPTKAGCIQGQGRKIAR